MASDADLTVCLDVVHRILVPGSGPEPSPGPSDYGAALPGVGATQERDGLIVRLVDVDWNARSSLGIKPDGGNRFVAIRVLYEATEDGGAYNPLFWSVVDLEGFAYSMTFGGRDPALSSSNDLPAGRKAQGWITFEVPRDIRQLEIVGSQFGGDYLRWLVYQRR